MSSNLSIATPSEGLGSEGHAPGQQNPRRRAPPAPQPEAPAPADPGQRLVIEEAADGSLIYTVIDRASGEVIARASRDDVSRMGEKPGYAAGALISTKA